MRISGLEEIDLDIDAADITALFDPFVERQAAPDDAEWGQEVQAMPSCVAVPGWRGTRPIRSFAATTDAA